MASKVTINLVGAKCPEPAVKKTIKETLTVPPGTILEILMDYMIGKGRLDTLATRDA